MGRQKIFLYQNGPQTLLYNGRKVRGNRLDSKGNIQQIGKGDSLPWFPIQKILMGGSTLKLAEMLT